MKITIVLALVVLGAFAELSKAQTVVAYVKDDGLIGYRTVNSCTGRSGTSLDSEGRDLGIAYRPYPSSGESFTYSGGRGYGGSYFRASFSTGGSSCNAPVRVFRPARICSQPRLVAIRYVMPGGQIGTIHRYVR